MALRDTKAPTSRQVPLLEKLAVVTVPGGDGTTSWSSSRAARTQKKLPQGHNQDRNTTRNSEDGNHQGRVRSTTAGVSGLGLTRCTTIL